MMIDVAPSILMPNKDFLLGAMFGIISTRKEFVDKKKKDSKPKSEGEIEKSVPQIGYWLEVTCNKCQRFYGYSDPNEVPNRTLVCDTDGCNNHIIQYGIVDPKMWRLGNIKFV